MHPDALNVRTQLYHSTGKIVTLIGEVFLKIIFRKELTRRFRKFRRAAFSFSYIGEAFIFLRRFRTCVDEG